jgi:hypothetical protein
MLLALFESPNQKKGYHTFPEWPGYQYLYFASLIYQNFTTTSQVPSLNLINFPTGETVINAGIKFLNNFNSPLILNWEFLMIC